MAQQAEEAPTSIAWQRSLTDARVLSEATGKPLLICVNMDGEPASERFATRRYKDPKFIALTQSFVPLVVSPNRHQPLDYTSDGRRIPCPRFGVVTCDEHVRVEPITYDAYFDKRRVAPRHVGVSPEGEVLFDLFLLNDLRRVDDALRRYGTDLEVRRPNKTALSHDASEREKQEAKYLAGNKSLRTRMLRAAAKASNEPFDLIRLGWRDSDPALRRIAFDALSRTASSWGQGLVLSALSMAEDEKQRQRMFEVLDDIGDDSVPVERARRVHSAIGERSPTTNWIAWKRVEPAEDAVEQDADASEARLHLAASKLKASPNDPLLMLEFAIANLGFAEARIADGRNPTFLLQDAQSLAEAVQESDKATWEASAVRARAAYLLSDMDTATAQAEAALASMKRPRGSRLATGVLEVLARSRTSKVYGAESANGDWPPHWLVDAHEAFGVLARLPVGTAALAAAHADLLGYCGLFHEREAVLGSALERFADAPELHQRYRDHVIAVRGIEHLEAAYKELRGTAPDEATHDWFSAYASLVVAEHYKRIEAPDEARERYIRATEQFEASISANPDFRDSTDHYVCLAYAGLGRIALEAGELEAAVDHVITALTRSPESATWEDGLKRTPLYTLQKLRTALVRAERNDLLERLAEILGSTAPDAWEGSAP